MFKWFYDVFIHHPERGTYEGAVTGITHLPAHSTARPPVLKVPVDERYEWATLNDRFAERAMVVFMQRNNLQPRDLDMTFKKVAEGAYQMAAFMMEAPERPQVKIHNGTPELTGPSLCVTCRSSHIIKGRRMGDEMVICKAGDGMLGRMMTFPVVSCNEYDNKNTPALWEMRKIAWKISVDSNNRPAGFLSPKKWKEKHKDDDD